MKRILIIMVAVLAWSLIGYCGFAQDDYCCDAYELAPDAVEVVEQCTPGCLEITATHNAIIKVGYRYIGQAPVCLKIKDSCAEGQVIPIIAEVGAPYEENPAGPQTQRTEFVCGGPLPVKIAFDLDSGLRTFSYFEGPNLCPPEKCSPERAEIPEKWPRP